MTHTFPRCHCTRALGGYLQLIGLEDGCLLAALTPAWRGKYPRRALPFPGSSNAEDVGENVFDTCNRGSARRPVTARGR